MKYDGWSQSVRISNLLLFSRLPGTIYLVQHRLVVCLVLFPAVVVNMKKILKASD